MTEALDTTQQDAGLHGRLPSGLGGKWYGVYPAIITNVNDPDGNGRVKVALPWSPDVAGERYEAWARLATLMGGNNRGSWFVPDVNDEVLVIFEAGDTRHPYVIGGLWNGQDRPPDSMDGAGRNYRKVIRSRNGVKITFDDTDGKETFIAETPGGQKITLTDGPASLEVVDSTGNSIKFDASGITLHALGKFTISAGSVEISTGMITANSGMSRFSGVVQADTTLTNTTISACYTPGAGNIW